MATNEFNLRKIETQVLKVHINCDGCKQKVKKILRRIEGVYTVDIDTDQHKVIVTGTVESDTLIKKLGRSGKHAEIWSPNNIYQNQNQNQEHDGNWINKNGKAQNQMQRLIKGLRGSKSRPMLGPSGPQAEDDQWGYYGYLNHHNNNNNNIGRRDDQAMTDDGMEQTIMANAEMDDNEHVVLGGNGHGHGHGHGYAIDGDGNMIKSMMGLQGFSDNNGAGFRPMYGGLPMPSPEYHRQHPSYMMMSNMQEGPQQQHNQPSRMMMNMGMRDMHTMNNNPMLNHYMQMHQPQTVNCSSSLFPSNKDCFGNLPY